MDDTLVEASLLAESLEDETAAHALLFELCRRFGWAVTIWDRTATEVLLGQELTEEQWTTIASCPAWETVAAEGYAATEGCVLELLSELGLIEGDR